jgi:hypothetical protein
MAAASTATTSGAAAVADLDLDTLNREEAHRAHDALTDFYVAVNESAIKSGDVVLRNCLLINGGAAIAILAFMGSVVTKDPSSHKLLADISRGLIYFAVGVVTSVLGMGLAYVDHFMNWKHATSQKRVWKHPYIEPGDRTALWGRLKFTVHALAVVAVLVSVSMFVCGLLAVEHAVKGWAPPG